MREFNAWPGEPSTDGTEAGTASPHTALGFWAIETSPSSSQAALNRPEDLTPDSHKIDRNVNLQFAMARGRRGALYVWQAGHTNELRSL